MELLKIEPGEEGKYLKKYELTYLNKTGKEKKYEMVSHHKIDSPEDIGKSNSGVSIVAFYQGKLLLLREFRMAVNQSIYNLCAGRMEPGEDILACINRELYEETGLKVERVLKILEPSYAAVSFSDVKTQIAFVEVSGEISDHTSDNEEIKAAFYTKEEVTTLLENEMFSSRAQVMAYFYTLNLFESL